MNSPTDGAGLLLRLHADFPELRSLPANVYLVGGAVRDAILGNKPLDIDLACHDARAVALQFQRKTGGAFVELGRERLATFRVVAGTRLYDFSEMTGAGIEEDLGRRDFTVNAVAMDPGQARLIDPAGGVRDLQRQVLRMVREDNFRDDPLRVLKGVRMVVLHAMSIEPGTLQAMKRHAGAVSASAAERISYELGLILSSARRAVGLDLLHQLNLDQQLLGFAITLRDIERARATAGSDAVTAWAALLIERESAVDPLAARWRWSERQRRDTHAAITLAGKVGETPADGWPILIYDFGLETSRRVVELLRVFERSAEFEALVGAEGERILGIKPLLEGDAIQSIAGIPPGPRVGQLKRALLEAQIRGTVRTLDEATALIRSRP